MLCNGANGTPNLVDRFVLGAGTSTPAVGTTGGSKDAIVVSHTHTVTDPGHFHISPGAQGGGPQTGAGIGTGGARNLTSDTRSTGISIAAAGASGVNANMPPYYALCYIMKT